MKTIKRGDSPQFIKDLRRRRFKEVPAKVSQLFENKALEKAGKSLRRELRCFERTHNNLLLERCNLDFGHYIDYPRGRHYLSDEVRVYTWHKLLNLRMLKSLAKKMRKASRNHMKTLNEGMIGNGISKLLGEALRRQQRDFSLSRVGSFLDAITVRDQWGKRGFDIHVPNNRREADVYFNFLKELGFWGPRFTDAREDNASQPIYTRRDKDRIQSCVNEAYALIGKIRKSAYVKQSEIEKFTEAELNEIKLYKEGKPLSKRPGEKYHHQRKELALKIGYRWAGFKFDAPAYARNLFRVKAKKSQ